MKKVIHADTLEELQVKAMGYHHDHCHHFYFGKTKDIPEKYNELITEPREYCFIYEEDSIPKKP